MSLLEPTSIRDVPFSGLLKSEYRPWRIKTEAIGTKFGWAEALTNDYQNEGNDAPTDEEKAEIILNDKGVTYLVLSCKNKAFTTMQKLDKKDEIPSMIELMEELKIDPDLVIIDQSNKFYKTNFGSTERMLDDVLYEEAMQVV
jgi:hypothetical protein